MSETKELGKGILEKPGIGLIPLKEVRLAPKLLKKWQVSQQVVLPFNGGGIFLVRKTGNAVIAGADCLVNQVLSE